VTPILIEAAADAGARCVTFGESPSDWQLVEVRLSTDATVLRATSGQDDYLFRLAVAGRHFATNALGVIAVADAVGADPALAARDLVNWQPPAGRGTRESVQLDHAQEDETLDLIDDAFNANPTSMEAAFEVLAASQPRDGLGRIVKGRRIAILGDMLELGPDEIALHQGLAALTSLSAATTVHCVGPRMRALYDALPEGMRGRWKEDAAALAKQVAQIVDAGDIVLVKGSKGSKVSLVVDAIRKLGHR